MRLWIQVGSALAVHTVSAMLVFVALVFVIPSFVPLFADFGACLPTLTQLSIGLSEFVTRFWFVAIPVACGGGLAHGVVLVLLGKREGQIPFWFYSLGAFIALACLSIFLFASVYLPMLRLA